MKTDILRAALKKRRGRNFDADEFIRKPKAGLDSEDLEEKQGVLMGAGVKEESIKQSGGQSASTDDLSPSKQEMEAKQIETTKKLPDDLPSLGKEKRKASDVGGSFDDDVFDEDEYEKIKKKRKASGLYEKMLLGLGNKKRGAQ